MQTITTPELILEPLTVAHAEAMFEVVSDPEIYRYLDYPPPPSIEHVRNVYSQLETRKSPDGAETWLNWVVSPRGHSPVGYVQATVLPSGGAWVAYALSSRYWGRGYAHAATRAMLRHLAADYGVVRFLATVEFDNQRSIRLLERLEFRLASVTEGAEQDLTATERLYVLGRPEPPSGLSAAPTAPADMP